MSNMWGVCVCMQNKVHEIDLQYIFQHRITCIVAFYTGINQSQYLLLVNLSPYLLSEFPSSW